MDGLTKTCRAERRCGAGLRVAAASMGRSFGPAAWWLLVAAGWLAGVMLAGPMVGRAMAADADGPIGWAPAYASKAGRQENATLRAVAFSPPTANPAGGRMAVGIAVGDHGVILRGVLDEHWFSEHRFSGASRSGPRPGPFAPMTWRPVANGGTSAGIRWNDVLWLSDRRVIAVGGNNEPVTGLSRGAAAVSDDAGQTWQLADADQVTRLSSLRRAPVGSGGRFVSGGLVLEADGDPLADSGITRFVSMDGGWSWSADVAATTAGDRAGNRGDDRADNADRDGDLLGNATASWIRDAAAAPGGCEFAVGDHGRISVRPSGRRNVTRGDAAPNEGGWHPVRGEGRRTGVLFVVDSIAHVPWALVGREALEMGHRVGVLVDCSEQDSADIDLKNRARAEQAATTLGAAFVRYLNPSAGRAVGRSGTQAAPSAEEMSALSAVDPVVVALATEMSAGRRRAWVEAAKGAAVSGAPSLRRVWMTELRWSGRAGSGGGSAGLPAATGSGGAGVLLSEALLPQIAVTAGDLWQDALMLVDPGRRPPLAIAATTFWESRGDGRTGRSARNVSLASGLLLPIGCQRTERNDGGASRRRLQMTTARMSQTHQFQRWLGEPRTAEEVAARLDAVLSTTASEDRTRLLWCFYLDYLERASEGWRPRVGDRTASRQRYEPTSAAGGGEADAADQAASDVQDAFLQRMATLAGHPAVRRWAAIKQESREQSAERRLAMRLGPTERPKWSHFRPVRSATTAEKDAAAEVPSVARSRPGDESPWGPRVEGGVANAGGASRTPGGGILSPFQIQPVGYERSVASGSTTLLVPQAAQIRSIMPAKQTPTCDQWEYHPLVMAARQVSRADSGGRQGDRRGEGQKSSALPIPQADDGSLPNAAAAVRLPQTRRRPRLDARLSDPVWQRATWWQDGPLRLGGLADADFVYLAVLVPNELPWYRHFSDGPARFAGSQAAGAQAGGGLAPSGSSPILQLTLDTDGDPLTHWELSMAAGGSIRTTVDHQRVEEAERPNWLAAVASPSSTPAGPVTGGGFAVVAEVALPRTGWSEPSPQGTPAESLRIRVRAVGAGGEAAWPAMPELDRWRSLRRAE